eukprot:6049102-Pyramimonas_sp.AAC.1
MPPSAHALNLHLSDDNERTLRKTWRRTRRPTRETRAARCIGNGGARAPSYADSLHPNARAASPLFYAE